jgi:hypothetical protein
MQTTLVNQLKVIAGVRIPDSPVAKQATDLLPEYGTTFIYNHSLRVFLFHRENFCDYILDSPWSE